MVMAYVITDSILLPAFLFPFAVLSLAWILGDGWAPPKPRKPPTLFTRSEMIQHSIVWGVPMVIALFAAFTIGFTWTPGGYYQGTYYPPQPPSEIGFLTFVTMYAVMIAIYYYDERWTARRMTWRGFFGIEAIA